MTEHSAWNPGLESDIPRSLLPLVTLFREENGFVDYLTAKELSDLTGIAVNSLAAFRPQRLVVHHLLVRVTANLSVQDGPSYEELGLNSRGMVDQLFVNYMQPQMDAICARFDVEKTKVQSFITQQLSDLIFEPVIEPVEPAQAPSLLSKIFGKKPSPNVTAPIEELAEIAAIKEWERLVNSDCSDLHKACFRSLAKTVNTIVGNHGRLRVEQSLLTKIVSNEVCNTYVADVLDDYLEPIWNRAVESEGYRRLPVQSEPVIMNVKGASASGKSTIRPTQRQLAGKLNIPWEDFALISPDYWRKYLLDYQSLDENYKYGAMLTGTELEIIDKKLDRYMAGKYAESKMSHLLIDRFRFDSFTNDIDNSPDSKLLSRFGHSVYLFFMITPPPETVERAWLRGIDTGRYKAVDDLLYHNVEAFTGMPSLFLSWVNSKDRNVHFEFLDNDVPLGTVPKTAAFGWNGSMTILDVELMLNVDRYRHVDITAKNGEQVLKASEDTIGEYTDFISRCAKTVSSLDFADQHTLETYASVKDGRLVWWDDDYISNNANNVALQKSLQEIGYSGQSCDSSTNMQPDTIDRDREQRFLVGQFGETEHAISGSRADGLSA